MLFATVLIMGTTAIDKVKFFLKKHLHYWYKKEAFNSLVSRVTELCQ